MHSYHTAGHRQRGRLAVPRAPKKCATTGCEERVRGRRHCDEHKPEPWAGSTRRQATTSAADGRLRLQVVQEEPTCRDCGAPTEVAGHIVPHAYGGPYTRENLKGQCTKCNLGQIQTDRAKWLSGGFR